MKFLILNVLLILFLISGIKNESDKNDNILILNDANFNKTVESFQTLLVEFCNNHLIIFMRY